MFLFGGERSRLREIKKLSQGCMVCVGDRSSHRRRAGGEGAARLVGPDLSSHCHLISCVIVHLPFDFLTLFLCKPWVIRYTRLFLNWQQLRTSSARHSARLECTRRVPCWLVLYNTAGGVKCAQGPVQPVCFWTSVLNLYLYYGDSLETCHFIF